MILRFPLVISILLAMAVSPTFAGVIDKNLPAISFVQYQSLNLEDQETPLTISGELRVPVVAEEEMPENGLPAVLVLHGSAGVDSRGSFYIEALNDAGIATFEIDMWGARNLAGGANRPALPTLTVPDAFGALNYLAGLQNIDAERIAVLGFSWGGVVAMLASTEHYASIFGNGLSFAAQVAHYPVCWAYNVGIPGINFYGLASPVLIQIGDKDDYDEGSGACENLIANLPEADQSLVSLNVYKNAYHAWDRLQPKITVIDPFSNLGAGGEVEIVPNPGKAKQSRRQAVNFIQNVLLLKAP